MAVFMLSPYWSLFPSSDPTCDSIRRRFRTHKFPLTLSRIPSPTMAQSPSSRSPISALKLKLSPFPELDSRIVELHPFLHRTAITIGTMFVAPDNPDVHQSHHVGAGVCFDPTLVLTSAYVVGRVSANNAYIGSLSGRTAKGDMPVNLVPLAVSFAADVAVLKIEERREKAGLDVCKVADTPPEKETILMAISHNEEKGWAISVGNVRSVGKKTIPAKAPWPLKDELGWIEHDWLVFYRGPPPPGSVVFNCKEKVSGSVTRMSGSPWFNLHGELVGVASWVLRDDPASFSVGYAAPMSNIWPVVHYAKSKLPHDPVVMDRWIDGEAIAGDQKG